MSPGPQPTWIVKRLARIIASGDTIRAERSRRRLALDYGEDEAAWMWDYAVAQAETIRSAEHNQDGAR